MTGLEIATVVSLGVNLLTGLFARKKAKQAKLLPVVIRGVESAAAALRSSAIGAGVESDAGKAIKRSIKDAAAAAGVERALNAEVKRVTRLVAYRR